MKAFVNPALFGLDEPEGMNVTVVFLDPETSSVQHPMFLTYGTDLTLYTWEEICDVVEANIATMISTYSYSMTTSDIIWMCPRS